MTERNRITRIKAVILYKYLKQSHIFLYYKIINNSFKSKSRLNI